MSAQDFGAPDATDLMVAIGDAYFARGALIVAVRALVSGIPTQTAKSVLETALIELRQRAAREARR